MGTFEVGAEVEARYKQLGLTQEALSVVARVSNSTIRNVLRGRVSEARTWPAIERALGWLPGSLKLIREGKPPAEVMTADALRSVWLAVGRMSSGQMMSAVDLYEGYYEDVERASRDDRPEWAWESARSFVELWTYIRDELAPAEAAPLVAMLRDYGLMESSDPFGERFVLKNPQDENERLAIEDAYTKKNGARLKATLPALTAHTEVRSPEEKFLEEVASHVGDTHVSLRRLGKDIGVGLIKVQANIPITSTHIYWLTEDDLKVIAQALENQVMQMARSLAHTRSDEADKYRRFQDDARRDWRRQILLVKELVEGGTLSVDEVTAVLGETPEAVREMIEEAKSLED